jgi:hypothetical protein
MLRAIEIPSKVASLISSIVKAPPKMQWSPENQISEATHIVLTLNFPPEPFALNIPSLYRRRQFTALDAFVHSVPLIDFIIVATLPVL